ncbi:MAG TPA: 6-phosphogluconolactonase [Planctomycetota bacterium]
MADKRSKLIVVDKADYAKTAADWILKQAEQAAKSRGVCTIALAGGATPRPVYEELGRRDALPWDQIDWYFSDERRVPMDHPESNYRMVLETLFKDHIEALGRTYRMPADAADVQSAAEHYGRRFPETVDILILGLGSDGHTASLFPGSPALDVETRRVVASRSPKPPHERLTITRPVIENARSILMLATGVEKAPMVARALGGSLDVKAVPAQLARQATWIVDQAAAGQVLNP